jgi:hypothetical protein
MSSIFESQRNFGSGQIYSKSVRNPSSPSASSLQSIEQKVDPSRSTNPSSDKPDRSDQREDLNWIAARAARAQMIQHNHQVSNHRFISLLNFLDTNRRNIIQLGQYFRSLFYCVFLTHLINFHQTTFFFSLFFQFILYVR